MYGSEQSPDRLADIPRPMIGLMQKSAGSDSSRAPSPLDNRLLAALPDADLAALTPDLELVELPARQRAL